MQILRNNVPSVTFVPSVIFDRFVPSVPSVVFVPPAVFIVGYEERNDEDESEVFL